jgi:Transglycosylase-like domain
MQTKTALAVAGSVLAVPSTALATAHDTDVPGHEALRASGRLTLDAHDRDRLVRANLRLARRDARLSGHQLRKGYARRVRDDAVSVIRSRNHRLRGRIARLQRTTAGSTASAGLEAIAACESGGNPSTNTGNGFYGKYQFTMQTWQSVGGTGNPAAAPEAEQNRRAAMLYSRSGSSPWPVCGQ